MAAETREFPLEPHSRARTRWHAPLVALVATAAFAAGLGNTLIGDDALLLGRVPDLSAGALAHLFVEPYWGTLHEDALYRPLALLVLAAERRLFGLSPLGYHAVGIAVHVACALGVLLLARRCEGESHIAAAASLAAALLFAAHPVHAESVITVHGQQDAWATAFFIVPWLLVLGRRATGWRVAGAASAYPVSLLFKEQGVLLPLILLPAMRRVRSRDGTVASRRDQWRLAGALLAAFVAYAALRWRALGGDLWPVGPAAVGDGYPLALRLRLVAVTLATYARLLVFPTGQTTYYGHLRTALSETSWSPATALLVAAVALATLARRSRQPTAGLATAWLAVTLAPVANVIPIGVVVAERLLYLPSVAVCMVAAAALSAPRLRRSFGVLVVIVLVAAGLVASTRVALAWRTPLSHWEATVAAHRDSPGGQAMLGLALLDVVEAPGKVGLADPRFARAQEAVATALRLNPRLPDAWIGAGRAAELLGKCDGAREAYARALQLRPGDAVAQRRLTSACR